MVLRSLFSFPILEATGCSFFFVQRTPKRNVTGLGGFFDTADLRRVVRLRNVPLCVE